MKFSLLGLIGLSFLVFGCGKSQLENYENWGRVTPSAVRIDSSDEVRKFFDSIQFSEEISLSRDFSTTECDSEVGVATLLIASQTLDSNLNHVNSHWEKCQQIFNCGTTTREKLKAWLPPSKKFRIGFAPLETSGLPELGPFTRALFIVGTNKIVLSTSLESALPFCSSLFHELVHFTDKNKGSPNYSTLKSEYKAHYYQNLLDLELFGENGTLIKTDRATLDTYHISRREILERIARDYKIPLDLSILNTYPPLPTEIDNTLSSAE